MIENRELWRRLESQQTNFTLLVPSNEAWQERATLRSLHTGTGDLVLRSHLGVGESLSLDQVGERFLILGRTWISATFFTSIHSWCPGADWK